MNAQQITFKNRVDRLIMKLDDNRILSVFEYGFLTIVQFLSEHFEFTLRGRFTLIFKLMKLNMIC